MERRAYLATLVGISVAGCTGGDGAPNPTTTGRPTTRATTTTTATPTATTTTTTEPPTETATPTTAEETTTEEPTTEATETVSASERRANRLIRQGRADLQAAWQAFLAIGGDGNTDPLAVTVDDGTFDLNAVETPTGEAQIHFTEASHENVEGLGETISRLQTVEDTIRRLAQAQAAVNACFGEYGRARRQFFDGDAFKLNETTESLGENLDEARNAVSAFRDTDFSALSATDLTSATTMTEKGKQLRQAISDLEFYREQFAELVDGMQDLDDGLSHLDNGNGADASYAFNSAQDVFEEVLDAIDERDLVGPLTGDVEDFTCVLEALEGGTDLAVKAADAAMDGNPELAESYAEDANEEYEECDIVDERFDLVT